MLDPKQFPPGEILTLTVDAPTPAHLLLGGESEEEGRNFWEAGIAEMAQLRDSGAGCYGITVGEATLLALSLLSDDLSERVGRYRNGGWEHNLPLWKQVTNCVDVKRSIGCVRRSGKNSASNVVARCSTTRMPSQALHVDEGPGIIASSPLMPVHGPSPVNARPSGPHG